MARFLRLILQVVAVFVLAIVVGFVVAVSMGIRVDLDPLRKPFETLASTATGRTVKLEGDVYLVPTWSITVEVQGLSIANPPGWTDPELARMDLARVRVGMLPLLWRRVVIRELTAEGVTANLEIRADGAVSWDLGPRQAGTEAPAPETAADTPEIEGDPPFWHGLLPTSLTLEELAFRNLSVTLADRIDGVERNLVLEEVAGDAGTDAPLEFSVRGTYDGDAFEASLQGGDPTLLIGGDEPWPLRTEIEVADTRFGLAAYVDAHEWSLKDALDLFIETAASPFKGLEGQRLGEVTITMEGERLDDLDSLFEVSLPRWGPHRLEARFEAFGGGRIEADVTTRVGASELVGTLTIESRREPPLVELRLKAPTVQLDDFALHGWSALEGAPAEATPGDPDSVAEGPPLLSPEVMRRLDASLDIQVEKVASGRDWLGNGRVSAQLAGGSFRLERFDLKVPGGSLRSKATLTPRRRSTSGSIDLRIERFDYGILARRLAPDTDMTGLFGMKVDLKATAPSAEELIEHATGRFDFAVFPEKLEAGVIDLWAVNVISAVLPALDSADESKVNCLVAMMDMQDGIMTEQALLVDTTRMTVHGNARIDFPKERIELQFAPTPKRPQFFSAATPVQVEGSFEDFGIGVNATDIIGTLIRMVTSIAYVPVLSLFQPPDNPDELDTCMAALDQR